MIEEQPSVRRRTTAKRSTEGPHAVGATSRTRNLSGEKRRAGPGRPKGSKNRSKSLVPTELANELLLKFEGLIPPEHFDYLRKIVKGGGAVSTERELDILILLLGRNLHPALVAEMDGEQTLEFDEEGQVIGSKKQIVFRKDVTERLKVLSSLLNLRHQTDKSKDEGKDGEQPLIKIVADRNLFDGGRLGILVGGVPGDLAGNTNGVGRPALPSRTVPDQVPER
jgi:hypothetical protein